MNDLDTEMLRLARDNYKEIEQLRAENADLESENEHLNRCITESTAQIHAFGWRISRLVVQEDKLKAENAELRKLVQIAWDKGQWSNENWEDWSAQHPILQHNS